MTPAEAWTRMLVVVALAGIVGFERERQGRAAGFRTHILVGLGSCLVMLTGIWMNERMPGEVDPSRMAAQVVSGIGFLGGGAILRYGTSVRGLTTAAGLWVVSGIGLAAGAGFLSGAVAATGLAVAVLFAMAGLEQAMHKSTVSVLMVDTSSADSSLVQIRGMLAQHQARVELIQVHHSAQPGGGKIEVHLKLLPEDEREQITQGLLGLPGVTGAQWRPSSV